MIEIRLAKDRGHTSSQWLISHHSFSFAEYYDPKYMHFSNLRVINEDTIAPNSGFPMHSHKDMEIITYMIQGELTHQDSLGNSSTIKPGEVQLMRAGSGITHSEHNLHPKTQAHLLQIWIVPKRKNLPPYYQQKNVATTITQNQLCKIISADKITGVLQIQQDVEIYLAKLNKYSLNHSIAANHKIWLQIISGSMYLNNKYHLNKGDGVGIVDETQLIFECQTQCEFILFDFS